MYVCATVIEEMSIKSFKQVGKMGEIASFPAMTLVLSKVASGAEMRHC